MVTNVTPLKANIQSSHTLQSLKAVDSGYWITELPPERRRFWFRRKVTYFLAIVEAPTAMTVVMVAKVRSNDSSSILFLSKRPPVLDDPIF